MELLLGVRMLRALYVKAEILLIHQYCSYFCRGPSPVVYLNSLRTASYDLLKKTCYLAVVALFATELVWLCLPPHSLNPTVEAEDNELILLQPSTLDS